jgi:hypothetical protein
MKADDFWYAVNNTEVVLMPENYLDTFGTTHLHYFMVSELMDTVNQIRIREGTIQSHRPQIITPKAYESDLLEGFGDEAKNYLEWLQNNSNEMRILEYGFKLQKKELNQHTVSGNIDEVVKQVKEKISKNNDPLAAVIQGVDDPWDVCLIKFMADVIRKSAPYNINELSRHKLLEDVRGLPRAVREEIEDDFLQASRNQIKIGELLNKLRKHGVFEEYEDRFFALVKQKSKSL